MAGQEGSNNNKCEALIPKFQYKRPGALKEMFPDKDYIFKPRVVSLGPVYHKGKHWQVTKDDKCKIKDLVLLAGKAKDFDSKEMKNALEKARDLYERKELDEMMKPDDLDEMKPDDFDEMMILDACFIIHAIDYITKGESEVLDKRPHLLPSRLEDMFLLENQVPIIVLEAAMNVLGRKYPKDIDEFIKKIAQSPEGAPTFWGFLMDLPCPIQLLVFLLLVLMILVLWVVVLPLALLILSVACLPLGLVWVMWLLRHKRCTEVQGGKRTQKQRDLEQATNQEGSNENEESRKEKPVEQASGQEPSHDENHVDPKQQKKKDSNVNKERDLPSDQKPSHAENQVEPKQQKKESSLLGHLRAHLLSCSEETHAAATHDNMWLPPRRATELTDAGIKFHRSSTNSVKDVTFRKGVIHGHLYLPSLAQLTKSRLVNLMVYELCQGDGDHGIISYFSFLDGLIDCPEDVKELRSTQILPKALGDDQHVAHFFNTLGNFLAPFAYHNVLKEIETHCHSRWRASAAKFCKTYFSSPWTTVSFLIAILLFVITIATAYKSFFGR